MDFKRELYISSKIRDFKNATGLDDLNIGEVYAILKYNGIKPLYGSKNIFSRSEIDSLLRSNAAMMNSRDKILNDRLHQYDNNDEKNIVNNINHPNYYKTDDENEISNEYLNNDGIGGEFLFEDKIDDELYRNLFSKKVYLTETQLNTIKEVILKESTNAFSSQEFNPRNAYPKVRGGWTKDKIKKHIRPSMNGVNRAIYLIAEFNDINELRNHLFWHGSQFRQEHLKPSIKLNRDYVERYGGGGYGDQYWGISLTKSKNIATQFSIGRGVTVHPILLCKNAKVVEHTDLDDAADIENMIEELWNENVDAVWIGGGEEELVVINPNAIVNVSEASEYFELYNLNTKSILNPSDAQLQELLNTCKEYVKNGHRCPVKPMKPSPFVFNDVTGEYEKGENGIILRNPNYDDEMLAYPEKEDAYYKSKEYQDYRDRNSNVANMFKFRQSLEEEKDILSESRGSKNLAQCSEYLRQNGYTNSRQVIEDLRNNIPNVRLPRVNGQDYYTFMYGVCRMFIERQLINSDSILKLNNILRLITSKAHINEYDRNLNGLSLDELDKRFSTISQQNVKDEAERLSKLVYNQSNYEIVPIYSFDDASEYSDYTTWCVTQYEGNYNGYTANGLRPFYFCLKDGYQNMEPVKGENCPLDEYGLSMIAVSVNPDGSPNTITCRWNHENGGNDSILTSEELSKIINRNFYDVFKPYTEEQIRQRREALIDDFYESCDLADIFRFNSRIEYNGKEYAIVQQNENIYSEREIEGLGIIEAKFDENGCIEEHGEPVVRDIFEYGSFMNFNSECGLIDVIKNKKINLLNLNTHTYLSNTWFDKIWGIDNINVYGARVFLGDTSNIFYADGSYLFDKFVSKMQYMYEEFYYVIIDNSGAIYNTQTKTKILDNIKYVKKMGSDAIIIGFSNGVSNLYGIIGGELIKYSDIDIKSPNGYFHFDRDGRHVWTYRATGNDGKSYAFDLDFPGRTYNGENLTYIGNTLNTSQLNESIEQYFLSKNEANYNVPDVVLLKDNGKTVRLLWDDKNAITFTALDDGFIGYSNTPFMDHQMLLSDMAEELAMEEIPEDEIPPASLVRQKFVYINKHSVAFGRYWRNVNNKFTVFSYWNSGNRKLRCDINDLTYQICKEREINPETVYIAIGKNPIIKLTNNDRQELYSDSEKDMELQVLHNMSANQKRNTPQIKSFISNRDNEINRRNQEDGWKNSTQAEINYWKNKGIDEEINKNELNEEKSMDKKWINMDVKVTPNKRTAVKMSIDDFKYELTHVIKYLHMKENSYANKHELENPGSIIYNIAYSNKRFKSNKLLKDMYEDIWEGEYKFDSENHDLAGGIKMSKKGFPYATVRAGGDWESPVCFFIYYDGEKLRGYVPLKGNALCRDTKMAFGNNNYENHEEDNFLRKEFKLKQNEELPISANDVRYNFDACLDDFLTTVKVTGSYKKPDYSKFENEFKKFYDEKKKEENEKTKNVYLTESQIRYIKESKGALKSRKNDEGEVVPDICPECGSKVGIYLQGEPIFRCTNEKCKKYFGVVPFPKNLRESSLIKGIPDDMEVPYEKLKSFKKKVVKDGNKIEILYLFGKNGYGITCELNIIGKEIEELSKDYFLYLDYEPHFDTCDDVYDIKFVGHKKSDDDKKRLINDKEYTINLINEIKIRNGLLVESVNYTDPQKVLLVNKHLSDNFLRASMPILGEDGNPKTLYIVGMKGTDGNVIKNMTAKQLFYYLQDKFKGIYADKSKRDKFLLQVMKDWYNRKITKQGMLTKNIY